MVIANCKSNRWQELKNDYKQLMISKKKCTLKKQMSQEQIYEHICKLNKFYLSEDIENINLKSFPCRILQLKQKFKRKEDDDINVEEEEYDDDKEEEENSDNNEDVAENQVTNDVDDSDLNSESDEENVVDADDVNFDSDEDTFGDIVLESEDEDPLTMEQETTDILYKDDGVDGNDANYEDFFGDVPPPADPQFENTDDEEETYGDYFDNQSPAKSESKSINKSKSTYEKNMNEEAELIAEVEKDNLCKTEWYLTGEVTKEKRPEYSVLEEDLEFTVAASQKPIETDDLNKKIEMMVLHRIKNTAFDNVERKIKPIVDPYDYRESFKIDEKKSKKSLADLYVEEFLKKREGTNKETPAFLLTGYVAPKDETDEKRNLRIKVANLFKILDGLRNKHHTPYLTLEEDRINSNAATLSIEEATPVMVSDAMMLAPEEIIAPSKRDKKGDTEKNVSDRKRERRAKKIYQKEKSRKEDDNLSKQLKTPSSQAAHQEAAIKFVNKAVKRGHVKVLESKQPKAVKTSQAFFNAIEETKNISQPAKKRRKI